MISVSLALSDLLSDFTEIMNLPREKKINLNFKKINFKL